MAFQEPLLKVFLLKAGLTQISLSVSVSLSYCLYAMKGIFLTDLPLEQTFHTLLKCVFPLYS